MSAQDFQYVYGPVPSRRLGRSLGVDLVPLKVCTYDCVYCQLGRTTDKTITRRPYADTDLLLAELDRRLNSDPVLPDYISIAGSGEPTLDSDVGLVIEKIKRTTDVPVAVLTNGSLLWMTDVQDALMAADLVLPSLDVGDARLFEHVNRPHRSIVFEEMVEGLVSFSRRYPGEVWLEVLLLAGVTGTPAEVKKIGALAERIRPARVQLNTVCRPPAERSARSLTDDGMRAAKALFRGHVDIIGCGRRERVEPPGPPQTRRADILALLRRRPCTAEDVAEGLHMHINEVVKALDALTMNASVTNSVVNGRLFYAAAEPTAGSET